MEIKINPKALRSQLFHPCTAEFIRDTCQARCCRSTTDPTGIAVTITPKEADTLARIYGTHTDQDTGRITPINKRCPHQDTNSHLCTLHDTPHKPAGCIISPFTINTGGTLIVRNRYRLLPCFKTPDAIPVAHAHRSALTQLFGVEATQRIIDAVDNHTHDTPIWEQVDTETVKAMWHKNKASSSNAVGA